MDWGRPDSNQSDQGLGSILSDGPLHFTLCLCYDILYLLLNHVSSDILPRFAVTKDGIEADLKSERPKWPFSAYGPGKDAPKQLFGGYPLEQSPEEMRILYYQAAANGNAQPAVSL